MDPFCSAFDAFPILPLSLMKFVEIEKKIEWKKIRIQCNAKPNRNLFGENPISITTAHAAVCICIFSWLNHFSTTTTTSLEIPTLDFGQYISVLDVRCILNLPQIPYKIYMCIWKPKICRPLQRCTLEIIELIWGKLIKLHSKHRNFLYFSF